jgi:hypothetical protein
MVWLHAPTGYLGASGAFEIGTAHTAGVPVYSSALIADVGLRQFVINVASPGDAVRHRKTMAIHRPGEPLKALQRYSLCKTFRPSSGVSGLPRLEGATDLPH